MSGIPGQKWGFRQNRSVLIAVPTFENIAPETFRSIFRNAKNSRVENLDFDFIKGYDCARARNKIVKKAIEGKYDYILMVDSDIIIPDDAIKRFYDWDFKVVFGYSPRKDDPLVTELYKRNSGWGKENRFGMKELSESDVDLVLTDGGSFGCVWLSTDIFEKLKPPYFEYVNYANGEALSEDLYFCQKARDAGIELLINTKVKCKHIAKKIIE